MNETQQALYDRVSKFSFDEGDAELTFARRLARENGWTDGYTNRAIEEYKRFMFLAVIAGHQVTPSDQVDQVWHLHLTYTRSYWDRFCGEVLGSPVHHGPTRGGTEESRKFCLWYQNTRESYRRLFGHEPPSDIWPDASIRFGENGHFKRINTERNWVIPKLRLRGTARKIVLSLLLAGVFCTFALGFKAQVVGGDSRPATPRNGDQSLSDYVGDHPTMFGALLWILIICGIIYALINRTKCHQCKRRRALERTGAEEKAEWFKARREEWKCQYCGYREWQDEPSCGGCG